MKKFELGLDIGSNKIKVYRRDNLSMYQEDSLVIMKRTRSKVVPIAVGTKAFNMIGELDGNDELIFPISEGVIKHKKAFEVLIKNILSKINPEALFRPKVSVIAAVSQSITHQEKLDYETVIQNAGAREVLIIESPNVVGAVRTKNPCILLDIGADKSEISVIDEDGIIMGCSLCIAGNMFTKNIADFVTRNHKISIKKFAAEKVKMRLASFYDNDTSSISIRGKSILSNEPKTVKISAEDIKRTLAPLVNTICDTIEKLTLTIPKQYVPKIAENGIFLHGGSSLIAGLDKYIESRLKIKVTHIERPDYATVLATEELFKDFKLTSRIIDLSKKQQRGV